MALILVVDDIPNLAEQYAYDLNRVGGFKTAIATSGWEALSYVSNEPVDAVILDLEMPGLDGFGVLRELKKRNIQVPVIVYTGTGDYERCVKAIQLGAVGFIDKSESMERVVYEVENCLERIRLQEELGQLKRETGRESPLIGSSQVMQLLKEQISRVAQIPSPVLIMGESGTGKELVAKEIHRLGGPKQPFVAINCAALPETLIEGELFGVQRGAFTGADRSRRGAFESADGGILFLDEIGELPVNAQAVLLRVLEEKKVRRLGQNEEVPVDTRVLAATNRDLEAEAEAMRFRQDLLFRLNVHTIKIPPLRNRLSDVAALADYFITGICQRFGTRAKRLSPEALEALMAYEWRRNNVRELRNIIERMIIATDGETIHIDQVPAEIRGRAVGRKRQPSGSLKELKAEAERQIIVAALDRNDWHITRTAKDLGLADHASLLKIMRRHNLKRS